MKLKQSTRRLITEYTLTIVIAVIVAFFTRKFIIEAYQVPSFAMNPTLIAGDLLFVSKWQFKFSHKTPPQRGDIVVYSATDPEKGLPTEYVRRIIGLPGDKVEVKDGLVILNGKRLTDLAPQRLATSQLSNSQDDPCLTEYTPEDHSYSICLGDSQRQSFALTTVPQDSYFVLGDMREKKNWKGGGIIPFSSINGKVFWIWLSIDIHSQDKSSLLPHIRWERMFRSVR